MKSTLWEFDEISLIKGDEYMILINDTLYNDTTLYNRVLYIIMILTNDTNKMILSSMLLEVLDTGYDITIITTKIYSHNLVIPLQFY